MAAALRSSAVAPPLAFVPVPMNAMDAASMAVMLSKIFLAVLIFICALLSKDS
jgi:hypothetical protein